MRELGKKHYIANEMRLNRLNPNYQAYMDFVENQANQLNPNNDEYKGDSEGKKKEIKSIFFLIILFSFNFKEIYQRG